VAILIDVINKSYANKLFFDSKVVFVSNNLILNVFNNIIPVEKSSQAPMLN